MKRSLPASDMVLTRDIRNQFSNLTYDDLKVQLKDFSHMDRTKSGTINIEQFRSALNLPDSRFVNELFQLLDVNESGDIDFREYIAGRALISQTITTDESILLAFNSFDLNHVLNIFFKINIYSKFSLKKGWSNCS